MFFSETQCILAIKDKNSPVKQSFDKAIVCGSVHIIKMVEIKKYNLMTMFIKKCGQTIQAAVHSWTIKSMHIAQ